MLLGIFNAHLCFCDWDLNLHTALILHNGKHHSYRPPLPLVLGLKTAVSEMRTWKSPTSHIHILLFFLLKVLIVCISQGEQVGGRVLIADWLDAACFQGNVIWLYTERGSMGEGRIYLASIML